MLGGSAEDVADWVRRRASGGHGTEIGGWQVPGGAFAVVGGLDEVAEGGRQREVAELAPVDVAEKGHAGHLALLEQPAAQTTAPAATQQLHKQVSERAKSVSSSLTYTASRM